MYSDSLVGTLVRDKINLHFILHCMLDMANFYALSPLIIDIKKNLNVRHLGNLFLHICNQGNVI